MYFAVIGDLIGSRRMRPDERAEAQAALKAALDRVNAEFSGGIAANFLVTLGDECQGLLQASGDPVAAALSIIHDLRRFPIRIAVGAGDITTPIDPRAAIGADGPAFHNARRMIEQMKTRHGARLRFAADDTRLEERLNVVSALCDKLYSEWTDKQELAVYAMLRARLCGQKLTQAELAGRMGVGQSTVNAQLSAAGFNEYCAGILHIRRELALIAEEETV